MKSLLLTSILLVTVVAPIVASRARDPLRGAKRLIAFMLAFIAVYIVYVAFLHPVLFVPVRPMP